MITLTLSNQDFCRILELAEEIARRASAGTFHPAGVAVNLADLIIKAVSR